MSKKTPPAAAQSVAQAAVANLVDGMRKAFKTDEIVHLVTEEVPAIPVIPTGIPALDVGLGCGGIPRGRIVEFYGPEMSGKTTLALQIIAQEQKAGGVALYVDAEHALDLEYAQRLGVDATLLPLSQPDNGEQALEVVEKAIINGATCVVVDSVAALVPKAELEGDFGDAQMGIQARLMSQAMRKLTGLVAQKNVVLIFINQLRMKIGVMFGNPETTTGGNALKFYASVRIDIRKGKPIMGANEEPIGQETNLKIVKNKCGAPFRKCSVDLIYGVGFDTFKSLLDVAIEKGVLEQAGAWVKFGDQKWNGVDKAKDALSKDPETVKKIVEAL